MLSDGIMHLRSRYSVAETIERLKEVIGQKGISLFTVIDHSAEAVNVGLSMPDTKLVVFGNPRAGTPLMCEAPTAALDLPLKILVAENAGGEVRISFNSADYLLARHGLSRDFGAALSAVEFIAKRISGRPES